MLLLLLAAAVALRVQLQWQARKLKVAAASQSDVNNGHDDEPLYPAAPAHRGRQHPTAAVGGGGGSSSSSWPALCAELEDEVVQLKGAAGCLQV